MHLFFMNMLFVLIHGGYVIVFIFCVWAFCLHVCKFAHLYAWFPRRPEESSDPLELELQAVVNHHVGVGNRTQVLCKSSKSS